LLLINQELSSLVSCGLECFLETWYSAKMWTSLREHPKFNSVVRTRSKHKDIKALAKVLADSRRETKAPVGRLETLEEASTHRCR